MRRPFLQPNRRAAGLGGDSTARFTRLARGIERHAHQPALFGASVGPEVLPLIVRRSLRLLI